MDRLAEYMANAPADVRAAYDAQIEQVQQVQLEAQNALRTAEAAILAACELLMASGRYVEARSMQPWLDKLEALKTPCNAQAAIASGNNEQGHADECHEDSGPSTAWTAAAASYRHQLTRLWLNIALQSL